ncbi:sensor histidine kinase [Aquibacillus sediminis]|uniref:sensor histidine kinase n=1 Tax=Aquibacillus sediminis TaxID=2574734 RepID=UPI0011091A30|nr:sensor histidine kinase [Aquibacillus sediminis]
MKPVLHRAIVIGVAFSILLMVLLLTLVFIVFPFTNWTELWERKLFELPFVLMILAITLFAGAIFGIGIGLFLKRQLTGLETAMDSVHEGSFDGTTSITEIQVLFEKVNQLQQYIREQTLRTQKLIDERVQDQEVQINKVVSEERNRLARELHDSVSQELFAASMLVSAINESFHSQDPASKQLQQVEAMIQQAQLEMRALLLHLRPVALKDKSLKDGVKQLLEELKQKVPIEVDWNMEQVTVSKGVEDQLFRILQESISNTLRHAKAQSLSILLIERDRHVILQVNDDGVGFDVEEQLSGSYGLMNMKERAAEMGAKFRIISVPKEGTRLEVRVPIMEVGGDEYD